MDHLTLTDQAARDAVRGATDRTMFVAAGAGSGKTTALIARVLRLVLDDGSRIDQIAAVTFTESAAADLRDRLREAFEQAVASDDPVRVARAEAALEGLDLASIGTLHSFARTILALHPIEAGMPPAVEVLDPIGSSAAAQTRWRELWRRMLSDEELWPTLEQALALGVSSDQLRDLAELLNKDWDLLQAKVLSRPVPLVRLPSLDALTAAVRHLTVLTEQATGSDRLTERASDMIAHHAQGCPDDVIRAAEWLEAFPKESKLGGQKVWGGPGGLEAARDATSEVKQAATRARTEIVGAVLARLTVWLAGAVLDEASRRRRSGTLEFHDLLVTARDVLRARAEVRESLHQRFRHLLLDEFQDTDPIQIEIAVRIAAGGAVDGSVPWQDVLVPSGSLFVVGDPKQSIYRFRRADIGLYLSAMDTFGRDGRGDLVSLTSNFRSAPGVVDWINHVFGRLIQSAEHSQPAYEALASAVASNPTVGPAVALLGVQKHVPSDDKQVKVEQVRRREGLEIVATIQQAMAEGWTTRDGDQERPLELRDITILLPARTALPYLEEALDTAEVEYRTEASSLVYGSAEVSSLLAAARAVADPSDSLSLVATLRSPLFGCGDDDLWHWKRDGGAFNVRAPIPEELRDTPVGRGMTYLQQLHRRVPWLSASQVLGALVADRRMFELGTQGPRTRDVWRRLRYIVEQARAWTDVEQGGLMGFLDWATLQASETVKAAESVLPESDLDAVRITTIHASKGLEYPMVILCGLNQQVTARSGVALLWTEDGFEVRQNAANSTEGFETARPLDEQMGHFERARLLYVGATRARDHLVVSLHRKDDAEVKPKSEKAQPLPHDPPTVADPVAEFPRASNAAWIAASEPRTHAQELEIKQTPRLGRRGLDRRADHIAWQEWLERITAIRERATQPWATSASGLEGTDPEVELPVPDVPETPPGAAKGARDRDLPAWSKGRDGRAVGRAVHGTLQSVGLTPADGVRGAVLAQCIAEDVVQHADLVEALVRSALEHPLMVEAAGRRHWLESYVGVVDDDGTVRDGIIDLLFEDEAGDLVVLDHKTDAVTGAAVDVRAAFYEPQVREYVRLVEAATQRRVSRGVLLFLSPDGAVARTVLERP